MKKLIDRVDQRATGSVIAGEAHVVGEDLPNIVILDEVPYPGETVTIGGFTEVTTEPEAGEFRIRSLSGLLPGALEFHSSADGEAVEVSYTGAGSYAYSRDWNRAYERIRRGAGYVETVDYATEDEPTGITAAAAAVDEEAPGIALSPGTSVTDSIDVGTDDVPVKGSLGIIIAPGAAKIVTIKGLFDAPRSRIIDPDAAGDIVFQKGTIQAVQVPWLAGKGGRVADQSVAIQRAFRIAKDSGLVNVVLGPGRWPHEDPLEADGANEGVTIIGDPYASHMQGSIKPACVLEYYGASAAPQLKFSAPYNNALGIAFVNYGAATYYLHIEDGGREALRRLSFVQPSGQTGLGNAVAVAPSVGCLGINNSDYAGIYDSEFASLCPSILLAGHAFTSFEIGERCRFALLPIDEGDLSLGGYDAIIFNSILNDNMNFFTIKDHTVFNYFAWACAVNMEAAIGEVMNMVFDGVEVSLAANASAYPRNTFAKLYNVRTARIHDTFLQQFSNNEIEPILYKKTNLFLEGISADRIEMPLVKSVTSFDPDDPDFDVEDPDSTVHFGSAFPGFVALTQGVSAATKQSGHLLEVEVGVEDGYPNNYFMKGQRLSPNGTFRIRTRAVGQDWTLTYGEPGAAVFGFFYPGQQYNIEIINETGGAGADIGFAGDFKGIAGVFTKPSDGTRVVLEMYFDGTYHVCKRVSDEIPV